MFEVVAQKSVDYAIDKTLGTFINKVQRIRVKHFCKGLTKKVNSEEFDDVKELLSSKFAKENLYDFISNSIRSSSEIGRYAIGKLYADFHNYPSEKLPYNKILLLMSLSDFDDLEVQIFLSVIDYWKQNNSEEKNELGLRLLRVEKDSFSNILVNGIVIDYLVTQRIFNNLFSRGLLDEAESMIGQYSGLNFNYSDLSEAFYDYLKFGFSVFQEELRS